MLPPIYLFLCLGFYFCHPIQAGSSSTCIRKLDDGSFGFQLQEYDPFYKICCGGMLKQRTPNVQCCNTKLYFNDKDICCNGQISSKTVSRSTMKWEAQCEEKDSDCIDMMCCGNELMPKEDNAFCCDGIRQTLTEDQVENKEFLQCCGKSVYNRRTHMCCGNIFPRSQNLGCCRGEIFDNLKAMCVQGTKLERTEGLCGGVSYSTLEDTCCGEQLRKHVPQTIYVNGVLQDNPDTECCGLSVISSDETCCEERHYGFPTHSIPKDGDLRCCGSDYYNQSTQFCRAGKPVARSAHQEQCGLDIIDTETQSCCANKIPYNKSSHRCCEGARYCVIRKEENCCNGLRMKDNEVCCGGIKPCKKGNADHDACCYDYEHDNGLTYKSKESTCNSQGELSKIREGKSLCGNIYYTKQSHFCCSHKIYKHGSGQCCNGIYNNIPPSEGRCCIGDNKAYTFDDPDNPCMKQCNAEEKYDDNYQICCAGKIYNYTGDNFCCGSNAINSNKMKCCGDAFPYRQGSRYQCCHNTQLYNQKYTLCNDDGKVAIEDLKGLSDVEKVCHPLSLKLFDGVIQQACKSNYAISGKIKKVRLQKLNAEIGGTQFIRLELRRVKSMTDIYFPRRVIFNIHIQSGNCPLDHLKPSNGVMVFFDDKLKHGKFVQIDERSHFFIGQKTSRRYSSVKEALSTNLCNAFSL